MEHSIGQMQLATAQNLNPPQKRKRDENGTPTTTNNKKQRQGEPPKGTGMCNPSYHLSYCTDNLNCAAASSQQQPQPSTDAPELPVLYIFGEVFDPNNDYHKWQVVDCNLTLVDSVGRRYTKSEIYEQKLAWNGGSDMPMPRTFLVPKGSLRRSALTDEEIDDWFLKHFKPDWDNKPAAPPASPTPVLANCSSESLAVTSADGVSSTRAEHSQDTGRTSPMLPAEQGNTAADPIVLSDDAAPAAAARATEACEPGERVDSPIAPKPVDPPVMGYTTSMDQDSRRMSSDSWVNYRTNARSPQPKGTSLSAPPQSATVNGSRRYFTPSNAAHPSMVKGVQSPLAPVTSGNASPALSSTVQPVHTGTPPMPAAQANPPSQTMSSAAQPPNRTKRNSSGESGRRMPPNAQAQAPRLPLPGQPATGPHDQTQQGRAQQCPPTPRAALNMGVPLPARGNTGGARANPQPRTRVQAPGQPVTGPHARPPPVRAQQSLPSSGHNLNSGVPTPARGSTGGIQRNAQAHTPRVPAIGQPATGAHILHQQASGRTPAPPLTNAQTEPFLRDLAVDPRDTRREARAIRFIQQNPGLDQGYRSKPEHFRIVLGLAKQYNYFELPRVLAMYDNRPLREFPDPALDDSSALACAVRFAKLPTQLGRNWLNSPHHLHDILKNYLNPVGVCLMTQVDSNVVHPRLRAAVLFAQLPENWQHEFGLSDAPWLAQYLQSLSQHNQR